MSTPKVILYDLPHKSPNPQTCWSPNTWKTRLVLNYKKIPYTSKFLEHAEIAPTLSSLKITPNPPSDFLGPKPSALTLPAITLPNGTSVQDSAIIAPLLEELQPEPSLLLKEGTHKEVQKLLGTIAVPLLPVMYPQIGRNVIPEHYAEWWLEKKSSTLGMSMQEYEISLGGEKAWKAAEPGFEALSEFLKTSKRDQGPFVLGSKVSYGDFILAAMLESLKRIGGGIYERFVGYDEQLKVLHEACGEWFEEDS